MPDFTPLQPGSRGPNVKFVQSRLRIPADGLYGSSTRKAVAQYQKLQGLPASGNVDKVTWDRLAGTAPKSTPTPAHTVAPWAWNPVVTADSIGDPQAYEYGPSVVAGRAFMCVGLGTDTLCSTGLNSANAIPPAFHVPDKLVADPGAVYTPQGYDLYFTLGNAPGDCNGVAMVRTDHSGRVSTAPMVMVIPQTDTPGRYGTGQPSVAVHPQTGVRWLAVRQERTDVPGDQICLYILDADGVTIKRQVPFAEVEDGASSEAFWFHGKLVLAVAGGGYVGFRTFVDAGGQMARERSKETGYPIQGGGQFWAQNAVPVDSGIDGVGVVRDHANQPIVGPNNSVTVWRGKGDPKVPGTWQVVKMTAQLP